jgi:hypothetical protein
VDLDAQTLELVSGYNHAVDLPFISFGFPNLS